MEGWKKSHVKGSALYTQKMHFNIILAHSVFVKLVDFWLLVKSGYSYFNKYFKNFSFFTPFGNIRNYCHLNLNIINTSRQQFFEIRQNHKLRVGKNTLCNKLHDLNGKILLEWLNLWFDNYHITCKHKLLTLI
jgi:hypothetical protein